ncbi:putative short-chain dehydrogenase/reductase SDR [Magnetofaba australis IT-1]|uniref:Putative short-chain dehydrogenase/reductase SDR n=1 Tax=Magnetofaba australis IT-1 TaxID=1434232 RepID=A0A1Y2K5R3_9PROT|nr:putative short-chain dehydrogenase/reductase SDR [Magnetofaba australis IT-1]
METIQTPQQDRVALVVGASGRVGEAMGDALAAQGIAVVLAAQSRESRAQSQADSIIARGGRALAVGMDLRNPAAIESAINETLRQMGRLDIVINAAGMFLPTDTDGGVWELMQAQFVVNAQGPLWLTFKAAEAIRHSAGQGVVIHVGDVWGERPLGNYTAYSAAKAALRMGVMGAARDLAPAVRVNLIAPGAVAPPNNDEDNVGWRRLLHNTPLRGEEGVAPVVQAMRYLIDAPFVTGEILHVDGGRRLV